MNSIWALGIERGIEQALVFEAGVTPASKLTPSGFEATLLEFFDQTSCFLVCIV